jgi:hypothetical protein
MFTTRKMIGSGSLWLLAALILPLCLTAPCAAASSTDLTARANHLGLPPQGLTEDPPDIIIPKPPAIPPPARMAILAEDPPDIIIPKPPAIPPPARY